MARAKAKGRSQNYQTGGKASHKGLASEWRNIPRSSSATERKVWSPDKPSRSRPTVSYKIVLDSQVNALIDAEDSTNIVYKNWATKSPSKGRDIKARSGSTSISKSPLVQRHSYSTAKPHILSSNGDVSAKQVSFALVNRFSIEKKPPAIKQTRPTIEVPENESFTDEASLNSGLSVADETNLEVVRNQSPVTPTKRMRNELPKRLNMTRPGGNRTDSLDDDDEGILLDSNYTEEKAANFKDLVKTFSYQNPDTPLGSNTRLSDSSSSQPINFISQKREESEASPAKFTPRKRELSDSSPMLAQSPSKSPSKKSKPNRGYAPPSTYAHLKSIPDHIPLYADVLICGINPGTTSSTKQRHFAHNGNLFWPCMNASGLVKGEKGQQITCDDDHTLPAAFNIGLTNLVHRPTAEAGELSKYELSEHVPKLIEKIRKFQPRIVCLVGKGIWQAIEESGTESGDLLHDDWAEEKVLMAPDLYANLTTSPIKNPKKPFTWGLQPYVVYHDKDGAKNGPKPGAMNGGKTYFFVVMSTSGRVAAYRKEDRTVIFTECRRFVAKLRAIHPSTEKHIKDWQKSLKHSNQPTEAET